MKSVALVFRKPFPIGQYSIESIFDYVCQKLQPQLPLKKIVLPFQGTSIRTLLMNMWFVSRLRDEIVHVSGDVHYALLWVRRAKTILTIHDCTHASQNTGLKRRLFIWLWLRWPVRKADCVVAISEATADDIVKYTGYPKSKIRIIPSFSPKIFPFKPREDFPSCVSILIFSQSPNKNLDRFIEASKQLPVCLLILGRLTKAQHESLNRLGVTYENIERGTEEELQSYYARAHILLFASLKEGFGMPIVEAQQQGLPVITSDCSSMPWVAGQGALFVDPFSVSSIRAGIERVITEPPLRNQLIITGKDNAKRFTPDTISLMYRALYEELSVEMGEQHVID